MKQTSFRIPDETWELAMERAKAEGVGRTALITYLLEGYAYGAYILPALCYPTKKQRYETDAENA